MISNRLSEIRKSKNLTMKAVAEAIGMKPDSYRNYESGRLEPNLTTLAKLADFYHVSTDYLLGRDTSAPDPLDELTRDFNMSAFERKIIDDYLSLPKNLRTDLMDFLYKAVKEIENESNNSNNTDKNVDSAETEYEKSLGIVPDTKSSASNTTDDTEKENSISLC